MIKETGFLDGVFTAEELDSNNVKDKESKISFLNKLISAVSMYRLEYSYSILILVKFTTSFFKQKVPLQKMSLFEQLKLLQDWK